MKKYIIFEQDWTDNFYIRLESTHDTSASALNIAQLGIIETMSFGTPFFVLKMVDGFGDMINHTYLSPSKSYDIYIGKSQIENKGSSFCISSSKYGNTSIGKAESIAVDLTFMSDKWTKLLKDTHSRSWYDMRYSEVLQELSDEIGFVGSDIETTRGKFNIIQPDWTNLQLIKWMTSQARTLNSDVSGFDFVVTSDNRLVFKSYNEFYNQTPAATYVLSTPENDNDIFFGKFDIKQEYASVLSKGGFGLTHTHFDYNKKTFVTNKKKLSETQTRQLSDWAYISKEHETAEKRFYGGRDTNTPSVAEHQITDIANSVQKIEITTKGNIDLHVGNVVNLLMLPTQYSKTAVNEKYSGFWLISKITHDVDFEKKTFVSHIVLSRSGFNGVKLTEFTKTIKGKELKK